MSAPIPSNPPQGMHVDGRIKVDAEMLAAFYAHVREPGPTVENPAIYLYDTPALTLAFWSANATRFEFPSHMPERRVGEDAMLYDVCYRDLMRPQWFYRHRQHWPMIPLRLDFGNALVKQFDFTHSTLPVVRTMDGEFCLFPEVAKTWSEHEQLCENLCIYFNKNAYARPVTIEAMTWPHHHKYHQSHKDEKTVRRRCMLALMRFREHWGMLAYVAFGTKWESRLEEATEQQRKMGVDPRLIEDLKRSGILDGNTPRVGTIVDIEDAGYPFPISRATGFRAPVWVLFGRVVYLPNRQFQLFPRYHHTSQRYLNPNPDTNRLSLRLRDVVQDVVRLRYYIDDYSDGPASPVHAEEQEDASECSPLVPPLGSAPIDADPLPFPGSGQLFHQNFDQFFADRNLENRENEYSETPGQRALRLARLSKFSVSGDAPPAIIDGGEGIYKIAFFEWVPSEQEGFFIRQPISFSDACSAWIKYRPTQRLYDPHRHEVDLCAMLDSPAHPEAPAPDISFVEAPVVQDTRVPEYAAAERQLVKGREPVVPNPTPEELASVPSLSDRMVARRDQWLPTLPDAEAWVQWRFGFHFPPGPLPDMRFNWRQGLSAGMRNSGDIHPLDPFIAEFGHILTGKTPPTRQLISRYADISPGHPHYLDPCASLLGVEAIALRHHQLGATCAYRLFPAEESTEKDFPWMFVVEEASSVVLAIRHGWGRTRDLLTAKFVEHCIPFHTLAIRHGNPFEGPITLPDLVRPLPVREKEAVFMDYANYEAMREEFFSGPRGRAMVRYGGVMRRLYCADELQAPHRLRQVISGPTQLAHIIGDAYTCYCNGEDITLCEDAFTAGEMAFICGQYCPRRDMAPECKESWYSPFSFSAKYHFGRNGGIWNNHDEYMYHDRRNKILESGSVPMSVKKWTNCSKTNRVSHGGEKNYEAMCVDYLCDYIRIKTANGIRPRYSHADAWDSFVPMSHP